jgi:maleylpyruvate isomerase
MPEKTSKTELLRESTQRLVRTVDSLPETAFAEPCGLPAWTRAQLVAHLTLNAEGLADALTGLVQGEPTPMYRSRDARDEDIDKLGAAESSELRDRLLAATTQLADAVAAVPEDAWGTEIERVPGGPVFRAGAVPGMRLREVEIHHADLDAGYTRGDWSPEFATLLLDSMAKRGGWTEPFRVRPTDVQGTWAFGEGGPTVTGTAADLGWWLTGRGSGEGLTSDSGGELPGIGAW